MSKKITPFNKLSKSKRIVLSLLHKGAANSITSKEISKITGITQRNVREIVNDLRITDNYPIGSSRRQKAGYYLITSNKEKQETLLAINSQIKKMTRTANSIRENEF